MLSPDRIDLLHALVRLSALLKKFTADALTEEVGEHMWFELADILAESARQCRQQTPVEATCQGRPA
ncbi:MAG: hypothetical protein ACJ72N_05855 [Labedaea sp.]